MKNLAIFFIVAIVLAVTVSAQPAQGSTKFKLVDGAVEIIVETSFVDGNLKDVEISLNHTTSTKDFETRTIKHSQSVESKDWKMSFEEKLQDGTKNTIAVGNKWTTTPGTSPGVTSVGTNKETATLEHFDPSKIKQTAGEDVKFKGEKIRLVVKIIFAYHATNPGVEQESWETFVNTLITIIKEALITPRGDLVS